MTDLEHTVRRAIACIRELPADTMTITEINVVEMLEAALAAEDRPQYMTDLTRTRATLDDLGGWLLNMGDGRYLRTDDEALVRKLRGDAFIERCETSQCWDETRASTRANS